MDPRFAAAQNHTAVERVDGTFKTTEIRKEEYKVETVTNVVVDQEFDNEFRDADAEYNLEDDAGKDYDVPMFGWDTLYGERREMDIKSLKLGEKGKIKLHGTDDKGKFVMKGRYKPDGKVVIKKVYEDGAKAMYKGNLTKDFKVMGTCRKGAKSGEFGLDLSLTRKFSFVEHYLGLTDSLPLVGLYLGDNGWGVVVGSDATATPAKFMIFYASGTVIECDITYNDTGFVMGIGDGEVMLPQM